MPHQRNNTGLPYQCIIATLLPVIVYMGVFWPIIFFLPNFTWKKFCPVKNSPKMLRLIELGPRMAKLALSICLKMKQEAHGPHRSPEKTVKIN